MQVAVLSEEKESLQKKCAHTELVEERNTELQREMDVSHCDDATMVTVACALPW